MSNIIDRPLYVIVRVSDRQTIYEGKSLARASYFLEPGTVYGRGQYIRQARDDAQKWVVAAKEWQRLKEAGGK